MKCECVNKVRKTLSVAWGKLQTTQFMKLSLQKTRAKNKANQTLALERQLLQTSVGAQVCVGLGECGPRITSVQIP